MQIVIVEDRPWKMKKSIRMLRRKGAEVKNIIFVTNHNGDDEAIKEQLREMEQELELEITPTDRYNFENTMDRFYEDKNNLFFCDLNLSGNRWMYFDDRENVRYAMKIKKRERELKRIWFYTTAGESTNEQINANFPNRNISVDTVDEEQQVILDEKHVEKIIDEYLQ